MTAAFAAGSVQFFDGATPLGTQTVSGPTLSGGTAVLMTTLAVGSHTLSAVFTPTTNHLSSTSSIVPYTVNPIQTVTSLSVGPPSPTTAGTQET